MRDTALDEKNYFSPERAAFKQQQPGGTLGGPIKKGAGVFLRGLSGDAHDRGDRNRRHPGAVAGRSRRQSVAMSPSSLTGSVNGPYWASLLSQRLGYGVSQGERYYVPGCTTTAQCVFPNAVIPMSAWSAPAQHLLQYVPTPNSGASAFSTGAFDQTVRDDKGRSAWTATADSACGPATTSSTTTGRQSVSDAAGRRQRPRIRRADGRPRATPVARRQQGVSIGARSTSFISATCETRTDRHAARRPWCVDRVPGLRHRSRHARHRCPGAAVRGRRERRLSKFHDRRHDDGRESDEQHAPLERQSSRR